MGDVIRADEAPTDDSIRPQPGRFVLSVGVIAMIAAVSTAWCLAIGVPAWGMFTGWIGVAGGGGTLRGSMIAWGSVLMGFLLGMAGAVAIASLEGAGGIAVPFVVFIVTAAAVFTQKMPLLNSVLGYFIGMTAYFASGLPPAPTTFVTLAVPITIGAASGFIASYFAGIIVRRR